jgi:DNA-binding response OmpR family regulator
MRGSSIWEEVIQAQSGWHYPSVRASVTDRSARILLVDDEQSIQTLLSYPLRKEGYNVVQATDGRQALDRFDEQAFDLVVLDVMLPKIDGLEVCRRLRSRSAVPIIMLTARSEEIDKVVGLELGADDYITKPFSLREFSSRIKAALRRAELSRPVETAADELPLELGELRIDFPKRAVRVRGDDVELTFVEFEILAALARAPGRVFTRDMLLARIWGDSAYRDPRTIDVHIRHLREKLELDAKDPEYLFTVRGVGYRFRDSDQ